MNITTEQLNSLDWRGVESSQIEQVAWADGELSSDLGWNPPEGDDCHLVVQFTSSGEPSIYSYRGVSEAEFEAFLNATSQGRFLNASIKGVFPYTKLKVVKS